VGRVGGHGDLVTAFQLRDVRSKGVHPSLRW
jgi:hypothetical protein